MRVRALPSKPLQQVAGELALGPLARLGGRVDVGALLLIAANQALVGHDLQGLSTVVY